jgi:Nuclease A inhibitor-like protein
MPYTSLFMLETALNEAAKHLMRAAGQDERLSPREFRNKLTTLSGEMRDLTEILYKFVVEIDKQGANHITETDIENAVARIKKEIFPHYVIEEIVLDDDGQGEIMSIAPKSGLDLALQLYQTARAAQVLRASEVFEFIQSYTEDLIFDAFGSEGSAGIEAFRLDTNLTALTKETFATALGLDQQNPKEVVERFQDAGSFLPLFARKQLDFELEEQAQALIEIMEENLRQIAVAIIGADDYSVDAKHPVYVVGLAGDGSLVGFKSVVIWT